MDSQSPHKKLVVHTREPSAGSQRQSDLPELTAGQHSEGTKFQTEGQDLVSKQIR